MLIRVLGYFLVLSGMILMFLALRKTMLLIRTTAETYGPALTQRKWVWIGIGAFVLCFFAAAAYLLVSKYQPSYWLFDLLICLFGVTAYFVARYSAREEQELRQGAAVREELIFRDKLLNVVNEVAALLIGSEIDDYDITLFTCMEKLGNCVDADRVYIWQNHLQDGEQYCTQIYEWSGGADPQQGNELTVSVPFPGAWYPNLSQNKCINGPVRSFTDWEWEREHLEAQGIVSILIVPVFLHGEFWGFVGFDDCERERVFSDAEEAILRSGSLLFATSFLRNEMTGNLIKAREAAELSDRAKTDFLANMSHELRTPINVITGMTNIIRMSGSKDKVDESLGHIDTASHQLLAIISDVLDMSKIEAGKMEMDNQPFLLASLFDNAKESVSLWAREKKQTFEMDLDEGLPEVVVGDDLRLSQVLLNLLSNAAKFTPVGGLIRLTAQSRTLPDGREELEMAVSDTGIGIDEEAMERLFAKFEQADRGTSRRFGGIGLGLSIAKSIVEKMDGSIDVQTKPGEGSTFVVRVCLQRGSRDMLAEASDPVPAPIVVDQYDFSGRTVLLVEDIEINREIVKALLEDTGIQIEEALNGQMALEMVKAAPDRYDLIFMDIHMPVMDGYAATRAIRSLEAEGGGRRVPIVAMTANAFAEDVQRCIDAGMDAHIAKPVDLQVLLEKAKEYMG